jgi:hypothetical protein
MSAGFYKRRRGVVEHIEAGTIDLLENGIHDFLCLKANLVIRNGYRLPAGVVSVSAPMLCAHCKRVSERTMQRILNHFEDIGWLKLWKTPGKRGNYMALICRASVHDLSGNEYRVNGESTTDWRNPVYERVGEESGTCPPVVLEVSTLREKRIEKRESREEKTLASKTAPPADPRHKPFFGFAYEAFRMKYLQPPTWGAKHCKGLQLFLASHPQITQDEWQRRYENFLASGDQFHQKQSGSLLYFVGNFDQFIERTGGNGNKKTSADQRTRENLAAAGLLNVH